MIWSCSECEKIEKPSERVSVSRIGLLMRHSKPSFSLQVFGWQNNLSDRLRFHKVMGYSHIVISPHFLQNIFTTVCMFTA
jgi:hypothetical protein